MKEKIITLLVGMLAIIIVVGAINFLDPKHSTVSAPLYFNGMVALRTEAVRIPSKGIYTFTQAMYRYGMAQDYVLTFQDGVMIEYKVIGTAIKYEK